MMRNILGTICAFLVLGISALGEADEALVLHLPFDGNVAMAVGGELGEVEILGAPRFVEGRHGQAVELTGTAALRVPVPEAIGRGEFSISFWLKPLWHPKDGLPYPIMEIAAAPEKHDAADWAVGQLLLTKGWSETIGPNHVYGVSDPALALQHLVPNEWTHVVLCYSIVGGFQASYFDGEGHRRPQAEVPKLDAHGEAIWLASRRHGEGGGNIVLDDFRVYNRPLNPDELAAVAGAAFPPPRDWTLLGTQVDPEAAPETPHVAWAKPFAGKAPKIVFVTEGQRGRDMIELAQRLDVELVPITGPGFSTHSLLNPEVFHRMGTAIETALAEGNVDVVVLGAFGWNLFLPETREAILAYLRGGGGLLMVNPMCIGGPGAVQQLGRGVVIGWAKTPEGAAIEALVGRLDQADEDYLTGSVPWGTLDLFASILSRRQPSSLFRGGRVGEGRVLIYDIRTGGAAAGESLTPSPEYVRTLDLFEYDYAIGAAAKAVLWAAAEVPAVRLRRIHYEASRFVRETPVGMVGEWYAEVLNAADAPARIQVELTVRSKEPEAPFVAKRTVTLAPGTSTIALPYTTDRFGEVFGDIRLLVDGEVADWGSATIAVGRANPWIEGLRADRESYGGQEAPRLEARLAYKSYGVSFGEAAEVRWRLYDAGGRLLRDERFQGALPAYDEHTERVSWDLPPLPEGSLSYRVIVDLYRNGKQTDQQSLVLRREPEPLDDLLFTSWGSTQTSPASLALLIMRDRYRLDCVGANTSGNPLSEVFEPTMQWLNEQNFRPWVYATHLGGKAGEGYRRVVDLSDGGYRERYAARLEEVARVAQPYSPLFYSLGDEVNIGPLEANPTGHEQERFRQWLQRQYGKIAALNDAWGTEYESWQSVVIPELKGLTDVPGPMWGAVQSFRHQMFADVVGVGVEAVRRADPGAHVGIEGIFGLTHAWGAFDYSRLTEQATFMGQYALGMELDMVRSLSRPDSLTAVWYNYDMLDSGYSRYGPWHTVLRGSRNFMWYTSYEASRYTALNPDLTAYEQFGWTWEELEPLLDGIGKLIFGLEREDSGVRIIHEHRNLNRTTPHFLSMMVTTRLLEDMGIAYSFVRAEDIAAGGLEDGRAKVVFLPGQFVMEPAVASAIRRFAEAGGAIVAGLPPAAHNGIERYDEPPLDDLFVEPGPLPTTAGEWQARVKGVGAGRSLLFGTWPNLYNRQRFLAEGASFRAGLGDFLSGQGIVVPFEVEPVDGGFQPLTVVPYRDGQSAFVGLQRDYRQLDQAPRRFRVTGPADRHVYDVRAGAYLGKGAVHEIELEVARGALLAYLPYQATAIELPGMRTEYRGGERMRSRMLLTTVDGQPSGGVYRVEVFAPDGSRWAPLCRKVRSQGGVAELELNFALNDPAGGWKLRVSDVATGIAVERQINLLEGK